MLPLPLLVLLLLLLSLASWRSWLRLRRRPASLRVSVCSSLLSEIAADCAAKMVIPTGLTADGRPTSVQVWGRAVEYDDMFDDEASVRNDVSFLYVVQRVAAAIQGVPELRRQDAALVRDLFASDSAKL